MTCYGPIYDLYLDLPHPDASPGCDSARLIGPHPDIFESVADSNVSAELCDGTNLAKISRYAFCDRHDDQQQRDAKDLSHPIDALDAASVTTTTAAEACGGGGTELNRHDVYMHSFTAGYYHTFILRLSSGVLVHGHVRRYLPPHRNAGSRADVGRRGPRAMVILTRSTGGEKFWNSVLYTIEAMIVCLAATSSPSQRRMAGGSATAVAPIQAFLIELHEQHAKLHKSPFLAQSERGSVTVSGIEFDMCAPSAVPVQFPLDIVKLHLPESLQPAAGRAGETARTIDDIDSQMMPLLRCLGPTHFMRLLSALLCERRVILISTNVGRLSSCIRGAAAMLAQGLLVWQHVYIPVLPLHLLKYLATPAPYLIGLLEEYTPHLEMIPGIGDVLCVDVDRNAIWTYHVPDPSSSFPDLLSQVNATGSRGKNFGRGGENEVGGNGGNGGSTGLTTAEALSFSLDQILEMDKGMWGMAGSGMGLTRTASLSDYASIVAQLPDIIVSQFPANPDTNGDETAKPKNKSPLTEKVTKWVGVFGRRKNKPAPQSRPPEMKCSATKEFHREAFCGAAMREEAMEYQREPRSSWLVSDSDSDEIADYHQQDMPCHPTPEQHTTAIDVPSGETEVEPAVQQNGCSDSPHIFSYGENETGEESLRNALVSFFLALFGDMGMYLSESADGSLLLDRKKFLLLRKMHGDAEHTPMFKVLAALTRSDMFTHFIKMQIEGLECECPDDAQQLQNRPLFSLCKRHLLMKGMCVTNPNIPQLVKMVSESCPQHRQVTISDQVRTRALSLTSKNQSFDDTFLYELVTLSEECHDVNGVLPHVLSVIWTRLQQCGRSSPLFALHLLQGLLLHGPLTVIPEATEKIDLVQMLMAYSSAKSSDGDQEVRELAECIYDLLLDRATLFAQRRHCAGSKMQGEAINHGDARWEDYLIQKLPWTVKFDQIHSLLRPKIGTVDNNQTRETCPSYGQHTCRAESDDGHVGSNDSAKASEGEDVRLAAERDHVEKAEEEALPSDLGNILVSFNSTTEPLSQPRERSSKSSATDGRRSSSSSCSNGSWSPVSGPRDRDCDSNTTSDEKVTHFPHAPPLSDLSFLKHSPVPETVESQHLLGSTKKVG